MRLNLRRARESQGLKLKDVSKQCHISVERLRAIEHYQVVPEFYEVIRILKCTHYYFDEICAIIWQDIEVHYLPKSYQEYTNIHNSLDKSYSSTEELERSFNDE